MPRCCSKEKKTGSEQSGIEDRVFASAQPSYKMIFRVLLKTLIILAILPAFAFAQTASGPEVGTRIEDFALQDQFGKQQRLSDLLSEGPLALVVLRSAGWCPHCKDQLVQLQSELVSIEAAGLRVVGLSFDEAQVLEDFTAQKGIEFPLLTDPQSRVIEQLGIVNTTREEGTIRHRVAYPLTILINSDSTVAGVVKSDTTTTLHSAQQLIEAWSPVKPEGQEGKISFIKVRENQFVDSDGRQVVFKGIAIGDPDKIVNDGQWSKKHFEVIKSWGVDLIRIPVHPSRLRKRGVENYLKLLDEAVKWCSELKIYVIIDWHSIGNLNTEKFEAAQYRTSMKETLKFWQVISKRFAGNPTVAFYEIFNEPTDYNGKLGEFTWPQWKKIVETVIDEIYANDKNVIPLVGGLNWAYDLREAKNNPINRPGVAYVAHPYPGKCEPPREPHWEEHFGFLASRYPIIATEMGYALDGEYAYMIDDGTYRNAILKYFGEKQISWCAWVFDPDWSPSLIKSYKYEPSHSGTFFRDAMLGR